MNYKQIINCNWDIPYRGGWCLQYVRLTYGLPAVEFSAIDAWNKAKLKHFDAPPLGIDAPIFFTMEKEPLGHVALRLKDGRVASSSQEGDHPHPYIHRDIDDLLRWYSNLGPKFIGWSEDVSNARVIGEAVPEGYELLNNPRNGAVYSKRQGAGLTCVDESLSTKFVYSYQNGRNGDYLPLNKPRHGASWGFTKDGNTYLVDDNDQLKAIYRSTVDFVKV